MTNTRRLLAVLAFSLGAVFAAQAAEMVWGQKKVVYAAVEPKELRTFLREFAAQQGVGVFVDPEVKGELTGRYELSPRSMMELLGRTFGLIWYFDGRVLYVYPGTSVESSVIRLVESSPAQLRRTIERLGIADARFPLGTDGERGTVMVSGPKRYVELVRQAAAASDRNAEVGDPSTSIRIYGLKYAFAEDYTVTSGGREFRMPGVVSILRQAFAGEGQARGGGSDGRRTGLTQRRPLEGAGGGSMGVSNAAGPMLPQLNGRRSGANAGNGLGGGANDDGGSASSAGGDDAPRSVSTARGVPSFAADPRTNAVLVRDAPSRIEQYEAVIKRLDERPCLVELETNIVEINADDFSELGIDWRVVGKRGQLEVGGGGIANAVTQPRGAAPPAPYPPGSPNANPLQTLGNIAGTVLGVVAGGRTQLFARISALEQAGKATVSAQPKVMTLNNVEAALDATNTFYVPVQGFQDAQLFDISAGTSIRITPSVVSPSPGGSSPGAAVERDLVRLLIKIEDGGLTGQSVGQLPVVQRTTINTQSLIVEGSTLLIAGYAQERESRTQNGVPGLSRVPVIGNLFKSTEKNRSRVERLFMITPRVVDVQAAERAPPLQLLPMGNDMAEMPEAAAPIAQANAAAAPVPAVAVVTPRSAPRPTPAAVVTRAPAAASVAASVSALASAPASTLAPASALALAPWTPAAPAPSAAPPAARGDPPPGFARASWALGFSPALPASAPISNPTSLTPLSRPVEPARKPQAGAARDDNAARRP